MPGFDVTIGKYVLVGNPFWGGVAFPLTVFAILFAWPALERRVTGDHGFHNLLDRPRDAPWRTAIGAAFLTWVFLIFFAGAADRIYVFLGISYGGQIWAYRAAVLLVPVAVLYVTRKACLALQRAEQIRAEQKEAEREAMEAAQV
jgi:ubiquinol-cytochrome c reductase cytochrome b subunit